MLLGYDAASDVAELVSRAFAPIANRQSSSENEIDDDDSQLPLDSETSQSEQSTPPNDNYSSSNGNNAATNGFMGNILRIIGLDTDKLGALAVNGIIFIAQIVSIMII